MMATLEYFVGAEQWWHHGLFLLISLFLSGGIGVLGEPESDYDGPQGTP
jgi:hypothetical protein